MGIVIPFPEKLRAKSPINGRIPAIELEPSDKLVDAYINKRQYDALRLVDDAVANLNEKIRSSSAALREHARKNKLS